jgi:excisionase family DNA binding protein
MTDALPEWIPRRLLSAKEVGDLLKISLRQVRRMIAEEHIETVRFGGAVRIRPEAIVALLDINNARNQ